MDDEPRNRRDAVEVIVRHHLGVRPDEVARSEGGHAASVFEVTAGGEPLIVKLYDDVERAAWFVLMAWVLERVREAGVPVPRILYHGGTRVPYAYLVYEKVPGVTADVYLDAHGGDASGLWHTVGRHAAAVNRIPAPGYGRYRHGVDGPACADSWRAYAEPEVRPLADACTSDVLPGMDAATRARLRTRLYSLLEWRFEPVVLHANLTGSNVVVDPEDGQVRAIIDWDAMMFGRAPQGELATALLWLDEHARSGFLAGYGLSPEEHSAVAREAEDMRLFYLMRYLLWHRSRGNEVLVRTILAQIDVILDGAEQERSNVPSSSPPGQEGTGVVE